LLAVGLGKPPLIDPDNWLVNTLLPSDQHDSNVPDAAWECLLKLSAVTMLVAEALAKL